MSLWSLIALCPDAQFCSISWLPEGIPWSKDSVPTCEFHVRECTLVKWNMLPHQIAKWFLKNDQTLSNIDVILFKLDTPLCSNTKWEVLVYPLIQVSQFEHNYKTYINKEASAKLVSHACWVPILLIQVYSDPQSTVLG